MRDTCTTAIRAQSVQLSSKIREMLRGVQETHKKMQTQLHQEEKDLAKGKKKCTLTAEVDFLYCPWVAVSRMQQICNHR